MDSDSTTPLLAALERATEEDLKQIDTELDRARKRVHSLEAMRKVLDIKLHGAPVKQKKARGEGGSVVRGSGEARRKKVVEYLASAGAKSPSEICKACDIPSGSISALLDHPYFTRNGQGVHITPLARRELVD